MHILAVTDALQRENLLNRVYGNGHAAVFPYEQFSILLFCGKRRKIGRCHVRVSTNGSLIGGHI